MNKEEKKMKILQYESIEKSVCETVGINKSTSLRVDKIMANMPAKYKGGKKAFVSALIEEALDNSSFEEVPREEQATI